MTLILLFIDNYEPTFLCRDFFDYPKSFYAKERNEFQTILKVEYFWGVKKGFRTNWFIGRKMETLEKVWSIFGADFLFFDKLNSYELFLFDFIFTFGLTNSFRRWKKTEFNSQWWKVRLLITTALRSGGIRLRAKVRCVISTCISPY